MNRAWRSVGTEVARAEAAIDSRRADVRLRVGSASVLAMLAVSLMNGTAMAQTVNLSSTTGAAGGDGTCGGENFLTYAATPRSGRRGCG
jgi:hypothetical protein